MPDKTLSDDYLATWLPGAKSKWTTLADGTRLRFVELGQGEPLLLMHTLNTQLDYFQRLAPLLKDRYRVILLDLPGHGYSTISGEAPFDEPFFRAAVLEAVKLLGLKRFAIGGESIGASLALTVSAALPKQVTRVFALNPYDYGKKFGGGVRWNKYGFIVSLFGIFRQWTPKLPVLFRLVLSGGFADKNKLPDHLFRELVRTGNRKHYRRAEYQLHKHWRSWIAARVLYATAKAPVVLVYGDKDWSQRGDRLRDKKLINPVRYEVLANTGHFSALENPDAVAEILLDRSQR